MEERIQKIISAAGVTSRRAAEQLITEGRVTVNGQVVTELGTRADASKDHIKVDGKLINPKQPQTYIMLNKPAGYITTMSDPERRPTVQDLLKGIKVRVYPVGRLDYNTEGLLLLTNDGDFAHLITHPKHELPKTYLVKAKGVLDDRQIEELEAGIFLDDGKTAPAKIKKVRKEAANSWLEITIHEGRKRQVRRMFDRIGRSVIRLKRIKTGGLTLGDLPEGSFRHLSSEEVLQLKEMAQNPRGGEMSGQTTSAPRSRTRAAAAKSPGRISEETMREIQARGQKKPHRGLKPDLRPWRMEDRSTGGPSRPAVKGPYSANRSRTPGGTTYGRQAEGRVQSSQWKPRTGDSPIRRDNANVAGRSRPARTTGEQRTGAPRPWKTADRGSSASSRPVVKDQYPARQSSTPAETGSGREAGGRTQSSQWKPRTGATPVKRDNAYAAGRSRPAQTAGGQRTGASRPWKPEDRSTGGSSRPAVKAQYPARQSRTLSATPYGKPASARVPFGQAQPRSGGKTFSRNTMTATGRPRPSRPAEGQRSDTRRSPAGSSRPVAGRPGSGKRPMGRPGGRPGSRGKF